MNVAVTQDETGRNFKNIFHAISNASMTMDHIHDLKLVATNYFTKAKIGFTYSLIFFKYTNMIFVKVVSISLNLHSNVV